MSDTHLSSAAAIRDELKRLNGHLDDALHLFADFEAHLNEKLKHAETPEQRSALFSQRNDYEAALGIEAVVNQIDALRGQLRDLE